jgi:hypothetical protein
LPVKYAIELNQTNSCADIGGEPHAVPRQKSQDQATGHIADVEPIDSAMCGLFGADHGTNMYDLASGNSHYQLGFELLDEGGIAHVTSVTSVTTSESSTNGSFDRGNRGRCLSKLR